MASVLLDVTLSLDGYLAGPGDDLGRLHAWVFGENPDRTGDAPRRSAPVPEDVVILEEAFGRTGAVIAGRRTYDLGAPYWGDEPPFRVPVFVLTHQPRETLVKRGGTTFTFVADGIESALRQARAAAGQKTVSLMGGQTARQFLEAGLVDEIQIHLVPILLGGGIRLFESGIGPTEWERTRVVATPGVTHLRFRAAR